MMDITTHLNEIAAFIEELEEKIAEQEDTIDALREHRAMMDHFLVKFVTEGDCSSLTAVVLDIEKHGDISVNRGLRDLLTIINMLQSYHKGGLL